MIERGPLRLAILCRGNILPRWQAQTIRHLVEMPNVELVVMITPERAPHPGRRTGLRGQLETRLLHLLSSTALVTEDLSEILAALPEVKLADEPTRRSDTEQLLALRPEAIFSFLPPAYSAEFRHHEKLPIWQFRIHGTDLRIDGAPNLTTSFNGLREVQLEFYADKGTSTVKTCCPPGDGQGTPVLNPVLFTAAWLPCEAVRSILKTIKESPEKNSHEALLSPNNDDTIINTLKSWLRLEYRRLSSSKVPDSNNGEWNIGILHQPIRTLLDPEHSMNVRWLPAPSEGNQRIEPFGYTALDGQLNVLYRKQQRQSATDSIARLRPRSESVLKRSRTMLSTSVPLHYPFVIERSDGAYALISYPHQGRTELFRVADTNDGLDHVKTLLNKALSSPTLTEFEGRWWLFGTDPDAPDTVLLAYYSDQFDGPFTPHSGQPLKLGAQGTRPAGTFFMDGGTLWRPAQDGAEPDISAVVLNRIIRLGPDVFEEEPGRRITGFPGTTYAKGIRTISAMGDITLIDGLRGPTPAGRSGSGRMESKRKRHSSKRS